MRFSIFRSRKSNIRNITDVSNIIQYDDMGYALRLVILDEKEQIWLDSYEKEGDFVLKWEKNCLNKRDLLSGEGGLI